MKSLQKFSISNFATLNQYGYETRPPGPLVRLNISGTPFTVKLSTLKKDPIVFEKILEDAEWLKKTEEYYFERDPNVFRFVHCYLRHNELHLPQSICGPLLEKELEAWGIQLGFDLQRCCLGPVVQSKSNLESLQKFEDKFTEQMRSTSKCCGRNERWRQIREAVWYVVGDTPKKRWLAYVPSQVDHLSDDDVFQNSDDCNGKHCSSNDPTMPDLQLQTRKVDPDVSCIEETHEWDKISSGTDAECIPFNWRHLQNMPKVIVFGRIYVAVQAIMLITLLMLMFLSYVPNYRVPFGPTLDLSADNETVAPQRNAIFVYRLYFAFDAAENRLTRPTSLILILIFICVIFFTADLIIRGIFSPQSLRWIISFYTITDALSLIPFYVQEFMYDIIDTFPDTRECANYTLQMLKVLDFINLLQLFVALRVFRLLQRKRAARVLFYSVRTSAVNLMLVFEMMGVACVIFGTAVFLVDDAFDGIFSGMWWALVTMATVGYGDIVPSSTLGYIISVLSMVVGILLTSYTVPILVNDFLLYYSHADQLAWMRRVHSTAARKRIYDRRMLMTKRRVNKVRVLLKTKVIGTDFHGSS